MREGGQILVLPSEEEAGGLPSRTHGESFNDKYNEKSDETNTSGDNHVAEEIAAAEAQGAFVTRSCTMARNRRHIMPTNSWGIS